MYCSHRADVVLIASPVTTRRSVVSISPVEVEQGEVFVVTPDVL